MGLNEAEAKHVARVKASLQHLSQLLHRQWSLRFSAWGKRDGALDLATKSAEGDVSQFIRGLRREFGWLPYQIINRDIVILDKLCIRCEPNRTVVALPQAPRSSAGRVGWNGPSKPGQYVPKCGRGSTCRCKKQGPSTTGSSAMTFVVPVPTPAIIVHRGRGRIVVPVSTPAIRGRGRSRGMVPRSVSLAPRNITRPGRPMSPPPALALVTSHKAGCSTGATRVWGSRRGFGYSRTNPALATARRNAQESSCEPGQFVPLGGRFID